MTAVNPIQPTATPPRDQRAYEPSMEEILASIRRIIADDQSLPGRGTPQEPTVSRTDPTAASPKADHADVHVLRPVADPTGPGAEPPSIARKPEANAETSTFAAHGTIAPQYATPEGPLPPDLDPPRAEAVFEAVAHAPAIADMIPEVAPLLHHREPAEPAFETRDVDDRHQEADEAKSLNPSSKDDLDYDQPLGRHEPIPFEPSSLFSAATDKALTSAFNTLAATRLADNTDDLLAMTREMIRPLLKTWLDDNLPSMVERLVRAEIERVARGGR